MIEDGSTAPDFSLPGIVNGQPEYYNLMDPLRDGRAALLLWYPVDFVLTITPDLVAAGEWLDRDDLVVWAISSDSLFAHEEYAETRDIEIPLLSDLHATIADAYDIVHEDFRGHAGVPKRAAFVVDPDWTIQYAWNSDDPLTEPTESPLVGAADSLSAVLEAPIELPAVPE
ncbi:alkyl hydroperoxide reductase/ Thiol specific antioxidant/ Mal allergen [Halorhabdus utahensis DSM 12940]|uniref:Alkyl hydroperoxide reductase/ Thiol specific antioxidant/ Mal allergen n=1 Tax=Halorhabdus utahensis (strain DSM 12940 / JCM 11049 / AX-2) TaxID=519442 RepID=C7NMF9_HALUD|nr:redoxin domain-containing protein [Halorhabdus utahensis]ACV12598.1 alkyl hydroperoxide reductase/ Thiol specific antioxidant/ Mal allergen [Halorhabdus utahensis DSM 12940]